MEAPDSHKCRKWSVSWPALFLAILLQAAVSLADPDPVQSEAAQFQNEKFEETRDKESQSSGYCRIQYGKGGCTVTLGSHVFFLEGITEKTISSTYNGVVYGGIASSALLNLGYIGLHLLSPPRLTQNILVPAIAIAGISGQALWYYYQARNLTNAFTAGVSYGLPQLLFLATYSPFIRSLEHEGALKIPALLRPSIHLMALASAPLEALFKNLLHVEQRGDIPVDLDGDAARHFWIRARLFVNGEGFYLLDRLPRTALDNDQSTYQKLAHTLDELQLAVIVLRPYVHKGKNMLTVFCYDAISNSVAEIHIRGDFGWSHDAPWFLRTFKSSDDWNIKENVHNALAGDVIATVTDAIKALYDRSKGQAGYHSHLFDERDARRYEYNAEGQAIGLLPQTSQSDSMVQYGSTVTSSTSGKVSLNIDQSKIKLAFSDGLNSDGYTRWRVPGWVASLIISELSHWGQELGYQTTSQIFRKVSGMSGLAGYMNRHRRESLNALYRQVQEVTGENSLLAKGISSFASMFQSVHDSSMMYASQVELIPPFPSHAAAVDDTNRCDICYEQDFRPQQINVSPCCGNKLCTPCLSRWALEKTEDRIPDGNPFRLVRSRLGRNDPTILHWSCPFCREVNTGRVTDWTNQRPEHHSNSR